MSNPTIRYSAAAVAAKMAAVNKRYHVENDHWVWHGATDKRGVPVLHTRNTHLRVRRLTWTDKHGEIARGDLYQQCDEPLCINPDHCYIRVLNDRSDEARYPPAIDRLLANVCIVDECWMNANPCVRGYGMKTSKRVSYKFYKGDLPQGTRLKSLCGNYLCVNPDHLAMVGWRDNPALADLDEKPKNWHSYKQKPQGNVPSAAQVEADMRAMESPRARLRRKFLEQREMSRG